MAEETPDFNAITWPIQLTKTVHRSLYPLLDPSNPDLSAEGKNVLITGASGGIGAAIAEAWTIAGAKGIVLTGRNIEKLNTLKEKLENIRKETTILLHPADISNDKEVEALWTKARAELGKINILINNAGSLTPTKIGSGDPSQWWRDFETNTKAPYLNIHHFLQQTTTGTVITLSTGTLADTYPHFSSYIPSKLATTKVMEFLHAEQPNVRAFTLFPGLVATDMPPRQYLDYALDDAMLSGGMTLFLATQRAEWLRGGMVSVNWDLEEMEEHRGEIEGKGLVNLRVLERGFGKGGYVWKT